MSKKELEHCQNIAISTLNSASLGERRPITSRELSELLLKERAAAREEALAEISDAIKDALTNYQGAYGDGMYEALEIVEKLRTR